MVLKIGRRNFLQGTAATVSLGPKLLAKSTLGTVPGAAPSVKTIKDISDERLSEVITLFDKHSLSSHLTFSCLNRILLSSNRSLLNGIQSLKTVKKKCQSLRNFLFWIF